MKDISKPASKETEQVAEAVDPFADLASLRLSQDFAEEVGVQRIITSVPVRRPRRQEFIQVRAGEEFSLTTAILELEEQRESYLVMPNCRDALFGEIQPVRLHVCVNRQNSCFVWPLKLEAPDGRRNVWRESALAAAERAKHRWIRVAADMDAGHYAIYQAPAELDPPVWPALSFSEILRLAFAGFIIDKQDHPVIRRLQGYT